MTANAAERYRTVRGRTHAFIGPLETEDFTIQSMEDASPIRWHIAHTTWFFETFVLKPHAPNYKTPSDTYAFLFNSYYNGVGDQFPRPSRGTQSRPTVTQIVEWRNVVDDAVLELLINGDPDVEKLVLLGTHHEEQHQELMVTDLKHAFASNPMLPIYRENRWSPSVPASESWRSFDRQITKVGYNDCGFRFDNEEPQHDALIDAFSLSEGLVTNGNWVEFVEDGGYSDHRLWLSDGWTTVQSNNWKSPLYWFERDGEWFQFTLAGTKKIDLDAPVTHVSFFEADAFATWARARLPTEFEWEVASRDVANEFGAVADDRTFHPTGAKSNGRSPMLGEVWEWTSSAYRPYPGYAQADGALGEYNGKFMNNQYVLKGGSCATSRDHIRTTYRNFFGPDKRWQFSGVRLAKGMQ